MEHGSEVTTIDKAEAHAQAVCHASVTDPQMPHHHSDDGNQLQAGKGLKVVAFFFH